MLGVLAGEAVKELQKGEVVEDVEELLAAPIYDEKIRERIRYIFDMIMKDDEKGKEQNAQGLYENRVINEIPVNMDASVTYTLTAAGELVIDYKASRPLC